MSSNIPKHELLCALQSSLTHEICTVRSEVTKVFFSASTLLSAISLASTQIHITGEIRFVVACINLCFAIATGIYLNKQRNSYHEVSYALSRVEFALGVFDEDHFMEGSLFPKSWKEHAFGATPERFHLMLTMWTLISVLCTSIIALG